MVNANGGSALELQIVDQDTLAPTEGCSVLQISLDGIYFNKGIPPRLGKTFLVPSAKADWLVVCNKPGKYEVITDSEVDTKSIKSLLTVVAENVLCNTAFLFSNIMLVTPS